MTNYDLIQGGPTRGESSKQQDHQKTLPEPSTTTNAIRNYPGSQLDLEKAQDVGPVTNWNHHYEVSMRYQASKIWNQNNTITLLSLFTQHLAKTASQK